jgi:hypothetical protein
MTLFSLWQSCQQRFVGTDLIANLDQDLTVERQKEIHAGTQLDEPEAVADVVKLSLPDIGYDPASYGSGYLPGEHPMSIGCFDDDIASFVLVARFGEECRMEITLLVLRLIFQRAVPDVPTCRFAKTKIVKLNE